MKKMITVILALMASMAVLLTGCGTAKLGEAFDETEVKNQAQALIDHLSAGEYEEIMDMMSSQMQETLPAEDLAAVMTTVEEQAGAFKEYRSVSVIGQKDDAGADYAVAVIVATCEKRDMTYTVSFDTDMKVIGLWMK